MKRVARLASALLVVCLPCLAAAEPVEDLIDGVWDAAEGVMDGSAVQATAEDLAGDFERGLQRMRTAFDQLMPGVEFGPYALDLPAGWESGSRLGGDLSCVRVDLADLRRDRGERVTEVVARLGDEYASSEAAVIAESMVRQSENQAFRITVGLGTAAAGLVLPITGCEAAARPPEALPEMVFQTACAKVLAARGLSVTSYGAAGEVVGVNGQGRIAIAGGAVVFAGCLRERDGEVTVSVVFEAEVADQELP